MTDLKYSVLAYNNFHHGVHHIGNYGDQIQSIAAARLLPGVDALIDRNELNQFSSPSKHVLLMNGFFGSGREGSDAFPPSDDIVPIYFGFHIAETEASKAFYTSPTCLEHFKKWEPIGCRDRGTEQLLKNNGINAFFSKCLTLTFDRRSPPKRKTRLFIVDGGSLRILKYLKGSDRVQIETHRWEGRYPGQQSAMLAAQHLLDLYRYEADKVVTARLHCALPCLAMGIPVAFLPRAYYTPHDRVSVYADAGGRMPAPKACAVISSSLLFKSFPHILKRAILRGELALRYCARLQQRLFLDWKFDSVELESEKKKIRHSLQEQIKTQLSKL